VHDSELFQRTASQKAPSVQNSELLQKTAIQKAFSVQNLEVFNVFDGYFKTTSNFAQDTVIWSN
jgi:hypothetical protein